MLSFIFVLFTTLTSFASVHQKLPNNHLAYYGQDFYQNQKVTKESLYEILSSSHSFNTGKYDTFGNNCLSNCYLQVSLSYDAARKLIFGELFLKRDNQGMYVEDVYCGKKFHYRDVNEAMRMNNQVNTEHTWPQSKFNRKFSKDIQKSDLHHLYPTDSEANATRGNYPFGTVDSNDDELNIADCESSKFTRHGDTTFEPPVKHRGNVARSLFYFATRYNMPIDQAQETILRKWHKEDPIDEAEKARHETIADYQNVRNPYIDFPHLVDQISDF